MNENQNQPDQDELFDINNFINDEVDWQRVPTLGNGGDNTEGLENSQPLLTTEQLQDPQNLSYGVPQAILQDDQQALRSRVVQRSSNPSSGRASSSLPLHALTSGEVQYPTNSNLDQTGSILPSSSFQNTQNSARKGLVPNLPNFSVGQASSSLQPSTLPNKQQAANEELQLPQNLSLEQAHFIIQGLASRTDQQAVPNRVIQHPQNTNLVQVSSDLEPSSLQNVQQAEMNRLVQHPQNLSTGPAFVNHIQTSNLENRNRSSVSAQLCDQEGVAIHSPGAELNVSNGIRYAPPLDELHRIREVTEGDIERNYVGPNGIPDGTRNTMGNGANPVSHQGGLHNQHEPIAQISAIPQRDTPAHQQHMLSGAAQLLNQINAPLIPQLPLEMNNQRGVSHLPITPTQQQTSGNATPQQDEANELPIPQLPNYSHNETSFENSARDPLDQHVLNSTSVQQNPTGSPLLNGSDAQGNNVIATEGGQRVLDMVVHGQQYSEDLQWISSLLSDLPQNITGVNQPSNEEAESLAIPDFQNHLQRPSLQGIPQGDASEQRPIGPANAPVPRFRKLLGSSYNTVFGREPDPAIKFSAQLTRMRYESISHEEISEAITVPELPVLDEEMVLDSICTGFDIVSWSAEEHSSPTCLGITRALRQSAQGTVVPVETLFNHLFCLSRRSFLQREERVHLELTTLFLKRSRLEGEASCEKDAKELISWLECTFTRGHLASLLQKFVIAIDETIPVRLLVDRAKSKYNPRDNEMTLLGAFYGLMNKQHDIIEMNQDLAKRKQGVERSIRQVKQALKGNRLKPPKATYEKKKTGINEAAVEVDHALIRSFDATKRLVVECTDSHYAYSQAVLDAAKNLRSEAKVGRDVKLEVLDEGLSTLEERVNELTAEEMNAAQTVINNLRDEEMGRNMNVLEMTVLECFVETILALGKVTVSALLQTIGELPPRLALILEDVGEELEKVRGIGSGEKPGVEDIVRVSQIVEEETEKHKKQQRILQKKISYLQECQLLLNGGAEAGPAPT